AIAGHTITTEKGNIVRRFESDPSYAYTPDIIAAATQLKTAFGNFYLREGPLDYDEVVTMLKPLQDVPVMRSYPAHEPANCQGTQRILPFKSRLQTKSHQRAAGQQMIDERKFGGRNPES